MSSAQVEKNEIRKINSVPTNTITNSNDIEQSLTRSKISSKATKKQLELQTLSSSISTTLYRASRMSTQRSFTSEQLNQLEKDVNKLKALDKNSFQYHLYNYLKKPYNFQEIESLKAAERMNAYDYSVLSSFAAYYYIQNDDANLKRYLKVLDQGKYYDVQLSKLAKLTLKSLPTNAILITHGKDDTFPLLIEQKIKSTRPDVEIICLDHLISETFRKKLMDRGFNIPDNEIVNTEFLKAFMKQNNAKNLFVASSFPRPYLISIPGTLHVVGLAMSAKASNEDNVQYYHKVLKPELQGLLNSNQLTVLTNILPLLFEVRNEFIDKGDHKNIQETEHWLRLIGTKVGKMKQINALLN
jgi:hypothetical protein